jgi:hypothetical protein
MADGEHGLPFWTNLELQCVNITDQGVEKVNEENPKQCPR